MNAAVVPAKALGVGKSRLSGALGRAELDALLEAMLDDVVAALRAAADVDRVLVTTPDPRLAERARAAGAEALRSDAAGLDACVDEAARALEARGAASLLVVLGDVAGVRAEEVARLYAALRELGGRGVVLAPAADGGTAALLRAPARLVPTHFGPESAKAHRRAAEAAGAPCRALALPSLALDLDRPEDLAALAASGAAAAPRTRALLARLGVAGRG